MTHRVWQAWVDWRCRMFGHQRFAESESCYCRVCWRFQTSWLIDDGVQKLAHRVDEIVCAKIMEDFKI